MIIKETSSEVVKVTYGYCFVSDFPYLVCWGVDRLEQKQGKKLFVNRIFGLKFFGLIIKRNISFFLRPFLKF